MISFILNMVLCGITAFGVSVLMRSDMNEVQKFKQIKVIYILLALSIVTHELKSQNYFNFSILKHSSLSCEDNFYTLQGDSSLNELDSIEKSEAK
jgi:hypothetical protein